LIITHKGGFIHPGNLSPSRLKEQQVEILNLGGAEEENIPPRLKSRKKTKVRVAVGIGSLAAITGLGSTLAASITLNGDAPVEFGQGVAITAACNGDADITFTPTSEYLTGNGEFVLSSFELSGINMSATDPVTGIGCAGKVLIIRAYTDDSDFVNFTVGSDIASPLYFSRDGGDYYNSGIAIKIPENNGDFVDVYTDARNNYRTDDVYINDWSSGSVEINVRDWSNRGLDSRAINKFTVESVESINTDDDGNDDGLDWYASTY
jgi:hypothetical protein